MSHRLHDWLGHSIATAWACRIVRCDPHRDAPKACVLLLVSVAMTVCAFLLLVTP